MKLYDKLIGQISFNNSLSINRAVSVLHYEFDFAVKYNNLTYAEDIVATAKKISDEFSEVDDKQLSYIQKVARRKLKEFVAYLVEKIKTDFTTEKKLR